MQHALRSLAIANDERRRLRAIHTDPSRSRAWEEFPTASCFSTPCATVVGTVVLTPQSVERVSQRIKYVVEDVGEENGKDYVSFYVANVDVTKLDTLMLVSERDADRVGDLGTSEEDRNPLLSEKSSGHTYRDGQDMRKTMAVDWGVPVSPQDCVGMNSHLRSGFFLHESHALGEMERENFSRSPCGATKKEDLQDVEEFDDGVEEMGWFVVDDGLIGEVGTIMSNSGETNMEEKISIVSPPDVKRDEMERKTSVSTPDCISLSDMIHFAGSRAKAQGAGERSYTAIDSEVFFPSPLSSRVVELLEEVKEGKRPTYRLCSSEYAYGTSQYIVNTG